MVNSGLSKMRLLAISGPVSFTTLLHFWFTHF